MTKPANLSPVCNAVISDQNRAVASRSPSRYQVRQQGDVQYTVNISDVFLWLNEYLSDARLVILDPTEDGINRI